MKQEQSAQLVQRKPAFLGQTPASDVGPAYIRILKEEFVRRHNANPSFSIRAFAKFLDVDPSAISRILNNKQPVSTKLGQTILQRIPMPRETALVFINSVADAKRQQTFDALVTQLNDISVIS